MENKYDLIVIGAGPGGYVAAIKAAKLGLRTAVIEAGRVGGTCLNRGCIPAKAMLHASSLYREIQEGERFGILALDVSFDYEKILAYKEGTTEKLVQGVDKLLKANGVALISGRGTLLSKRQVQVTDQGTQEIYSAQNIILATGSKPLLLPIQGMDLPGVLTSDELFQLKKLPESLVIIGGGVISVEFATAFAAFGCKITILEALPRLIPNMEKEISQNLKLILKKRGIDIHTSASVQSVVEDNGAYACRFIEKEKEMSVSAQYVLCAVGRIPNTEGLFGEGIQPEMERGRVVVDEHFKTSLEGVYAIGDLIKGMQLAHTASAQGMVTAEYLAGKEASIDLNVVPSCVYTSPEIASVGLTEDEAKEKGIPVRVGKFIMSANGKSLITQEERGFVKVVVQEKTDQILGAQMMCARATDMIGEFSTAIANHMSAGQLLKGMRAHPTYNEGVGEALEELFDGAIHVAPKKRR
ncbi:dihydrolipoyl dehydrogenase [Faecalicatena sp. AGMB00832]|uniref:Dihydrolipoyl dehydrogenase n=1 Tax=Faecalicatena faecalis TaxID=2726362 RepID=A0ABS6D3H8_9FIRM|nr:dihydrolipoyl dehydrogenase [Faecalicatena faecalis]MBU3876152.1 dihydrolipoyl dehydrogenase [Faecalicatena faecalis]